MGELEVQRALIAAEAHCTARGRTLNAPSRRVLRELLTATTPLKAYDLLGALSTAGRSAAPPTVYRALGFLVEHDLAHRIESLNAYVACAFRGERHIAGFRLCARCGAAEEFKLDSLPPGAGEAPTRVVFEASGLCLAGRSCEGLDPPERL